MAFNRGEIPPVVTGLCDDAAVFPPGLAPLPEAVRAYRNRRGTWYEDFVGPLVLAADALPGLMPLLEGHALPVSVTLPQGPSGLRQVFEDVAGTPVELRSVEVAVPEGMTPAGFADALEGVEGLDVYVEVPRDDRRAAVLDVIAGRWRAKFRTGGVRADLYPSEPELATALAAVVAARVPFKATAGLHHALRNTDPATGFEQHGFLNVLLATDALLSGGSEQSARTLLAERDGQTVAGLVRDLGDERARQVRLAFTSFGTCSITDPLTELIDLGVVSAPDLVKE
jgi:hypothetical protein